MMDNSKMIKLSNLEGKTKKRKKLAFLILFIGVVCFFTGLYLTLNDKEKKNLSENNVVESPNDFFVDEIKDFSGYVTYDMEFTLRTDSGNNVYDVVDMGHFDTLSNIIYSEVLVLGVKVYGYYDVANHLLYYSENNINWEKEYDDTIFPTFPTNVINKVKNNDNVTYLGNGKYSFFMSTLDISNLDHYDDTVPTTVIFDSNGYLSEVIFDATHLTLDTGWVSHLLIFKFSNINDGDGITIPSNIITGAIENK